MRKGLIINGRFATRNAQLTIFCARAGLHAAVVAIVEELPTETLQAVAALIRALAILHFRGSTGIFWARFVTASAAVVAACDGAVNLFTTMGLRAHLIETPTINLIACTQATVAPTGRLALHAIALGAGFSAVAKDAIVAF